MGSASDRTAIARACRILGTLELSHAALGHVSLRTGPDRMLIKGKGPDEVGLRYSQPEDVIEVDFEAEKLDGAEGLQPPSESFLHIWLYKTNPAVRCVVHAHPKDAVLLTICDKQIVPIYGAFGPGAQLAIDGVRTYPRSVRICTDALGSEFAEFMGRDTCCLMRGHGVAVTGDSVEDSITRTMALQELVSMTFQANLLGEPRQISGEDVAWFTNDRSATRRRGSAGGRAGTLARWRYYCRLAGEQE